MYLFIYHIELSLAYKDRKNRVQAVCPDTLEGWLYKNSQKPLCKALYRFEQCFDA